MVRNRKLAVFALWLIAGAVIGSVFGQLLALILPEGVVKQFFLAGTSIGFDPVPLKMVVLDITIGFHLNINVTGVLGILFAGYYFRWYQ